MSFRLRVFLLVMLVAVTAIGATAWLTLSLASKQIRDAVDASNRDNDVIARQLSDWAHDRGTWQGVSEYVKELFDNYGVRIRMATIDGQVIVDTDHFEKRASRPTVGPASLVDPRPRLTIPDDQRPSRVATTRVGEEKIPYRFTGPARDWVAQSLRDYRFTVHLTACVWTGQGLTVPLVDTDSGVARAREITPEFSSCARQADSRANEAANDDDVAVNGCPDDENSLLECLGKVFTDRVALIGPAPVQLFLGSVDEDAAGCEEYRHS